MHLTSALNTLVIRDNNIAFTVVPKPEVSRSSPEPLKVGSVRGGEGGGGDVGGKGGEGGGGGGGGGGGVEKRKGKYVVVEPGEVAAIDVASHGVKVR